VGAIELATDVRILKDAEPARRSMNPPAFKSSAAHALAIAALAFLIGTALPALATSFDESPCMKQDAQAACAEFARSVSHDINTVRSLGHELETSGRFGQAALVYETALTAHPNHRDLMQRLIYTRGQARAALLLAPESSPPPTSGDPAKNAPRLAAAALSKAVKPAASPPQPTSTSTSPAATRARNLAVIFGNERYADFPALRTPLADTRAIAAVLEKDYGFTVRIVTNATRYQMLSALSQLRRDATEQDNVLVYYAGHGYLDDSTSRGYWLPIDAEHDNVANWLSTSDITDMLAGIQARHALILADSCFSGTLLRSVGGAVAIDERNTLLRKLASKRSRTIMTSGGLEPVIDGGGSGHSVFADAVLSALRGNRDSIEAGRLFMQVRDRIALRASQTPQYAPLRNAGHDGGDFIFVRK
jgi:Caspase domain